VINLFSPDTNGIDRTHTITLAGSAEAGSTVTVFDGDNNLGQTVADAYGNWGFTENNASNGTHVFTATDTDANGTSSLSAAFDVTVWAHGLHNQLNQAIASMAPVAPVNSATPVQPPSETPLQLAPPLV
jgi:Bacterial Ig-like domain